MATIKYFLRGNKDVAQINVRFSINREMFFRRKTDFVINSKEWSDKTNMPKQTSAENKNLISKLNKLENYIFDCFNEDIAKGVLIDANWLNNKIKKCFNRVELTDRSIFVNYLQHMIDNAATRETRSGRMGLTAGTIKNYNNFKGIFEDYQQHIKRQVRFKDINKTFTDEFKNWLLNSKGYTINYTGKQFEFIKTVCIDAQKNDIEVYTTLGYIKIV